MTFSTGSAQGEQQEGEHDESNMFKEKSIKEMFWESLW